jgi:hypothetical protein
MNFITKFVAGQSGRNKGLTTGVPSLDQTLGGIRKYHSYGVAAAPKCGKTTLVDFCFVISPYLQALRNNTLDKLDIIYFSYEIDRISKEFKFAAFFFFYDFGITTYTFQDIVYDMDQDYLMGAKTYIAGKTDKGEDIREVIPITPEHKDILKTIYYNRIIPIFGEYDTHGNQIKPGKVLVIEEQDNPTGMYKYLLNYARKHGIFKTEKYTVSDEKGRSEIKERIIGFDDNTPDTYRIIVTDHIRKLILERGFTMKQNIDKWLEYTTILRNRCGYIFVNICHSNRGIANVQRLQHAGEMIFPTSDDVKDTGNLAEESTVLMTLFNPSDEKYNLTRHMGVELNQFPKYRSLHITESRYTDCPVHIQLNMFGNINYFVPLFAQF